MPKFSIFPLAIDRWIAGTRHLTREEKAAYLELLIYLFQEGGTIKNEAHACRILGGDPRTSRRLWAKVQGKFSANSAGSYHELVSKLRKNGGRISGLGHGVEGGSVCTETETERKDIKPPLSMSPPAEEDAAIAAPPSRKKSSTKKQFLKPTLEEVRDYCRERGNRVNSSKFHAHYEANGWKVGRNAMKNWKAAVRYWEGEKNDRPRTKDDYDAKLEAWAKSGGDAQDGGMDPGAVGEVLEGDGEPVRQALVRGVRRETR